MTPLRRAVLPAGLGGAALSAAPPLRAVPWPLAAAWFLIVAAVTSGATPAASGDYSTLLRDRLKPHPRLLIDGKLIDRLKDKPAGERSTGLRARFFADAQSVLGLAPLERKLEGRRLLFVSRDALHRIATLALAYRLTGERRYLDAARANLLRVAEFSDYNPSHFLDVAEMTTALAIGYDWLHDALPESERARVRGAIVDKGIKASFTEPPQSWIDSSNNWNQVCNGGMAVGALAVADDVPDLAADVLRRSVVGLPYAMKNYAPDGTYAEGPSYWDYGTTYNAIALAAMRSAVGTDFDLSKQPGFLPTADYHLHTVGPTGLNFSYSDGSEDTGRTPSPAAYFLAAERGVSWLLFNERAALDGLLAGPAPIGRGKANPDAWLWLLLLWTPDAYDSVQPPATHYAGGGITPVATYRSSWDSDATFVAVKGGTASAGHAHMDVGSFALDALGVRWASDLGNQSYNKLESRGIDLWNNKQGSQRWQVYRIGPWSHNILTVNGREPSVDGRGTITRSDERSTVLDLTSVYAADLAKAEREVELLPDRSVRVTDRLQVRPDATADVRWAMLTRAEVKIDSAHAARLSRDGKTLRLTVESPADATLAVEPADPPHDYDAPNPGARLVLIRTKFAAGAAGEIRVRFAPPAADPPATQPAAPQPGRKG